MPLLSFIIGLAAVWLYHRWHVSQRSGNNSFPAHDPLSESQAREILGVSAQAGPDEIKEAHRRLIKHLHPDQGGSAYLSQLVTQARDGLLHSREPHA